MISISGLGRLLFGSIFNFRVPVYFLLSLVAIICLLISIMGPVVAVRLMFKDISNYSGSFIVIIFSVSFGVATLYGLYYSLAWLPIKGSSASENASRALSNVYCYIFISCAIFFSVGSVMHYFGTRLSILLFSQVVLAAALSILGVLFARKKEVEFHLSHWHRPGT